jgi:A/G-specific adenine glycosylase
MEQDEVALSQFRTMLREWWPDNARSFPWRQQQSAYAIALAEIMLRRTRADQVAPVYQKFLSAFPTLGEAAAADPEAVREYLYPLGLAWRADTMVEFLHKAHERFANELPTDAAVLRELPGIGEYVSAAVACFVGRVATPLIDTNVVRVLGRIFGMDIHGEARRRRSMRDLAHKAVDQDDPVAYHYAILDFAAQVCTARKPHCSSCPFSKGARCEFFKSQLGS